MKYSVLFDAYYDQFRSSTGWPVMRSTHLNPNKIMKVAVTMAMRRIPLTTGPEDPLQLSE